MDAKALARTKHTQSVRGRRDHSSRGAASAASRARPRGRRAAPDLPSNASRYAGDPDDDADDADDSGGADAAQAFAELVARAAAASGTVTTRLRLAGEEAWLSAGGSAAAAPADVRGLARALGGALVWQRLALPRDMFDEPPASAEGALGVHGGRDGEAEGVPATAQQQQQQQEGDGLKGAKEDAAIEDELDELLML
eukprot:m51a1_g1440 hypothetical protein (197) ;mRNA; r:122269-122859